MGFVFQSDTQPSGAYTYIYCRQGSGIGESLCFFYANCTEKKGEKDYGDKDCSGSAMGDEGKGKMVDYLAQNADLIVRYQGGDNAGHTVVNDKGVFKLHLIPCGIFYDRCAALAGTGMVVNPDELLKEIADVESKGVDSSKLFISERATMLMPYHITLDELFERSKNGIGTTKRGIGPAYADKARRIALRMGDLKNLDYAKSRLESVLPLINLELKAFGGGEIDLKQLFSKLQYWSDKLAHRLVEPVSFVRKYIDGGRNVLFEGQLGVMKDLDLGIYPYVTSSNPTVAYACASCGVPIGKITDVTGVIKAFSSAVGQGPFPTEMEKPSRRHSAAAARTWTTSSERAREERAGWAGWICPS